MANFNNEEYTRTFSSFSGADMVATFNGRVIGELQGLSYSVSREVAPIYTMGSADARSFSRGKRGISGSLVFITFDRDALVDEMRKDYKKVGNVPSLMNFQTWKANAGALEMQIINGLQTQSSSGSNLAGIATWNDEMTRLGYAKTGDFDEDNLTGFYLPEYADQLMPFNITVTMANEMGQRAGMEIYGVQILNEGTGFSIDDVVIAKAYSFVARKVKGIQPKSALVQEGQSSASAVNGQVIGGGALLA